MRVLHVITGLDVGGAERMLAKLLRTSAGQFESHVVSLTNAGKVADEIRQLGINVHALGLEGWTRQVPMHFWRLVRLIRELRPDVVQTWMYHSDLFGGLAAKYAGINAVAWNIRNSDLSPLSKRTTRLTVRVAAVLSRHVPTSIVCCSEAAQVVHERHGYDRRRFVVIPNGFDLERFRPDEQARQTVRKELNIPADAPLIGLVARFDPQKDHGLFFAAAARLTTAHPTAHFLLAGRGMTPENPRLDEWTRRAGVTNVVRLVGERADIEHLTGALDIATSCSAWGEAFPNSLGEALACGVPCVTTDVGDARAIIGESGVVVPRGDADAIARAWGHLLSLSRHERRSLGARGRARIEAKYEIGSIAARYAALYESLAQGVDT